MIRTLLLAITVTSCLAQLEPDIGIDSPLDSIPDKDTSSLGSLLRDQLIRQTTSSRSNSFPTTTTTKITSNLISTTPTNPPISQILSSTIVPSNTVQANFDLRPQFQYVKALSARQLCYHNNQTYSIGQKWNDDCIQVCKCVAADELGSLAVSACESRCPTYNDPPGVGCTLVRSKVDECCLEYVCSTEGKLPPSTTMTLMNTEAGQLNVSTTEIKLPSSSSTFNQQPSTSSMAPTTTTTTTIAAATTTTTPQPPTITSQPIRSSISPQQLAQAQAQQQQQSAQSKQQNKIFMTTTQQQVPTTAATIMTTLRPPATTQRRQTAPTTTSSTPVNSRAPKQVTTSEQTVSSSQIVATQSPNSLPPQKPHSLVTTTNQPSAREFGQRMLTPSIASELEVESRQNIVISAATTTTTTTTETPEEADPLEHDLCIIDQNISAYPINLSWLDECNQTCRCVFKKEPRDPSMDIKVSPTINLYKNKFGYIDETEIRCSLSPQCAYIGLKLTQTNECHNPKLIFPRPNKDDNCTCPTVACSATPKRPINSPQTTQASNIRPSIGSLSDTTAASATTTVTTTSTTKVLEGCRQGKRLLSFGETFNDECHSSCTCNPDGEVRCQQINCPSEPPKDFLCDTWILDPTFKQNSSENQCCPKYICPSSRDIVEEEQRFRSCNLLGKEFLNGDTIPEEIHPRSQDCDRICTCKDGTIHCGTICPPISDIPPLDLTCLPEQAVQAVVDCCTQWLCPPEDYELEEFDIKAINSTSVNISFVLPISSIERAGRIELDYIGAPKNSEQALGDKPPTNSFNWIRKTNIKTEKGIFWNHRIKYTMNNLKPNHKYWFKVIVEFDKPVEAPFDNPLVSQIQQIVMPPPETTLKPPTIVTTENPTTLKQFSTTSTSTPPPSSTTTTTSLPTTTASSATFSSTTVPPTMRLQPIQSTPSILYKPTTTSSTTTTTTTTTEPPATTSQDSSPPSPSEDVLKPGVESFGKPPCGFPPQQSIDDRNNPFTLQWIFPNQMNAPIQKYAWHILVAFSVMTVMFTIVSYLYLKKSSKVIAPITSQSAFDNPSFTKLVSYYANQPHVLLVDESNQNYNNDAILAKQKNIEVDKSSPLHHHNNQIGDIHHHNGRQRLI